jgi:F-type H+-transporting ATPase subunit alpha
MKQVAGTLRLDLAQYRELAAFAQFASDLDEATRKQLDRGERVTELLKQPQYAPMSVAEMGLTLYAVNEGYVDKVEVEKLGDFERALHGHFRANYGELADQINESGDYNDEIAASLKKVMDEFVATGSY